MLWFTCEVAVNQSELAFLLLPPVCLAKVDAGTLSRCNFAGGEKAGASWTDKFMAKKAEAADGQTAGGEDGGEDEWVGHSLSLQEGTFHTR